MRFCHSFWTAPALIDRRPDRAADCPNIKQRLRRDPWLSALSAHYVKQHGHTLVLHTDRLGEKLFGFLPYDEVHCSLDDLTVAPDLFYSAGKVRALKIEPVGTVHVDGDALLKTPQVYRLIAAAPECDAVVQSLDYVWPNTLDFLDLLRPYLSRRMPWLFDKIYSYNSGIYGFRSGALRDGFIGAYEDMTQYLSRSPTLLQRAREHADRLTPGRYCLGLDPLLFAIITDRGYTAHCLWGGEPTAGIREGHEFSDVYEHHAFSGKYVDSEFAVLQSRLADENPDLYRLVAAHSQKLEEALS